MSKQCHRSPGTQCLSSFRTIPPCEACLSSVPGNISAAVVQALLCQHDTAHCSGLNLPTLQILLKAFCQQGFSSKSMPHKQARQQGSMQWQQYILHPHGSWRNDTACYNAGTLTAAHSGRAPRRCASARRPRSRWRCGTACPCRCPGGWASSGRVSGRSTPPARRTSRLRQSITI